MNYGEIPTWGECFHKIELERIIPERVIIDPIEIFIYDNEPFELNKKKDFRYQLQAVVEFLSDEKPINNK